MKFKNLNSLAIIIFMSLISSISYLNPLLPYQNLSIYPQKDLHPYMSSSNDLWSYSTNGLITSVAISSEGDYIVVGSTDKNVYLFDKTSSVPMWQFLTDGIISSVAISSDGNYIVAGSSDEKIYLFNKLISTPIWEYDFDAYISSIGISSDGTYIVVGSNDDKIYLFNSLNSTPMWTYETEGQVTAVSISSNGNFIAAGSDDNKIYLFNKDSSTPLWNYATNDNIKSVEISADGNYLVAGSNDDNLYIFDRSSPIPLWNYTTGGNVESVAISSEGNYITAGSNDNTIFLFSNSSSTPLWVYLTGGDVRSVSISSDGAYISVGSNDNNVYLFNRSGSIPLWYYSTGGEVTTTAISSDGSYTVAGIWINKVILFFNYPFNEITLTSDTNNLNSDGNFNLTWTPIINADNYSIYYHSCCFNTVNESVNLLESNITTNFHSVKGFSKGNYYFKVFAYNTTGFFSSSCLYIRVRQFTADKFNQIFSFIMIIISIGIISIGSSLGIYFAVKKNKEKKSSFKNSDMTAIKTSVELIEEIRKETPFLKIYIDSDYHYKEVPKIKDYMFSRLSTEELHKLDLIELPPQEKKIFLKEIINLTPQERKQLIDDMLRDQK